ncbi:MAG TPA: diacylglycerol kinase family protein [Gemmatimonadaceae bacterium]|nr:diacylglycerol kinase family protein [Gemmatimonadaceae bacterium]
MPTHPIPAFVNPASGSGEAARDALEGVGGFEVVACDPEHLDRQIERVVSEGAERIVVAGGDGTVAKAAAALVGKKTALAVVPGGTLNHFAKDHGIPHDPVKAAELSANGVTTTIDVATVNGRVFLNTSSVGAYVVFVRARERLEPRFGYRVASVIAAFRLLGRIRPFTVELEIDGQPRRYRSALVFVGVGERELQLPSVGGLAENGRRGLHVIVVRGGTWARLVAAGLVAAFGGDDAMRRGRLADSYVVDACRIELRRRRGRVAVDGEIVEMSSPLRYRIERNALRLVVSPDHARDE